jgi:hypothetical protein
MCLQNVERVFLKRPTREAKKTILKLTFIYALQVACFWLDFFIHD